MRKKCPFCAKQRGHGRPVKAPCQTCIERAKGDADAERFLREKYGIDVRARI